MSGRRVSRRAVLRGMAAAPLLVRAAAPVTVLPLAAAGCGADRGTVQIAVVWSGRELEVFRKALKHFRKQLPPVQLLSVGNGIESLLRSRIAAGNPPQIAVVSQPRLLEDFHKASYLVEQQQPSWLPEKWHGFVQVNNQWYGVLLKATHKSVFWHRLSDPFLENYQPSDLDELHEGIATAAKQHRGLLGIGAADGWVLTDWFENALLAQNPELYEKLATGMGGWESPDVSAALTWLGKVWQIDEVLAGNAAQALLTQYDRAALQVLSKGGPAAGLTFEGDFIAPMLLPFVAAGQVDPQLGTFQFPPERSGGKEPLVVGADIAVQLISSDRAKDVMECLASDDFARQLASHGFLTVHNAVTRDDYLANRAGAGNLPGLFADLAGQLKEARIHFDLSDRLSGGLAGGDGQGIWRILQDFFDEVTGSNRELDDAVEWTTGQLVEAHQQKPTAGR